MKLKHLKYLYLLTILSSSLLYAFSTTKIIASTQLSPFTITLMSTMMEIFIYIDLNYLKTLTTLSTRAIGSIGIFIFFIIQLLFMRNLNDAIILLITYLICSLLFNIYLLCLENRIVTLDGNMRNGLISITLLRNISKILGFGLGAFFQYISVWHYTFILLFTFIILCSVHIKNADTVSTYLIAQISKSSSIDCIPALFRKCCSVYHSATHTRFACTRYDNI